MASVNRINGILNRINGILNRINVFLIELKFRTRGHLILQVFVENEHDLQNYLMSKRVTKCQYYKKQNGFASYHYDGPLRTQEWV